MDVLIEREQLDELKAFVGHFNRKNSYRIISLLHRHPEGMTASAIMDKLGVQQSETSSTLRLLHRHGFTSTLRDGKFIIYKPRYGKFNLLLKMYCLIIKPKTNGKV